MTTDCHLCGGPLQFAQGTELLAGVTSDCRPWRAFSANLAVCRCCGTVQKSVTPEWQHAVEEIYSGYRMYSQGGNEQRTFDPASGIGLARSQRIVDWLNRVYALPPNGSLLDIGCGNGAFLKAFHDRCPAWELTGLELDERNRQAVLGIPNTQFCFGAVETLAKQFDLVVLVHALEHIPNPSSYLRGLNSLLRPHGRLFIEVPNLELSPFDLLITDHCTHFTPQTLIYALESAGLAVYDMTREFIPKELSALAGTSSNQVIRRAEVVSSVLSDPAAEGLRLLQHHLAWLRCLRDQALSLPDRVGIFGTSIAAVWLATEIGAKVDFLVDEDPDRIGQQHMGLPILAVADIPVNKPVLMPLRPDLAAAIVGRHKAHGKVRFILPPAASVTC